MIIKISFDPLMSSVFCQNTKHFAFWNTKEGNAYLSVLYKNQLTEINQGQVITMNAELNDRFLDNDFNTTKFKVLFKKTYNHFIKGNLIDIVLGPIRPS